MNQTPISAVYPDANRALTAVRTALVLLILCGGLYPSITTTLAGWLFPTQSTGSLILRDGSVIGSTLIGQAFKSDRYFYGRPSAAGYNPFAASGSNLAPSNPDLRSRIATDAQAITEREQTRMNTIPADLLASSGSGIDPHISPAAAEIQVARVARVRSIDPVDLRQLLAQYTEPPVFGVLGQPRVNVLKLNLALDAIHKDQGSESVTSTAQ